MKPGMMASALENRIDKIVKIISEKVNALPANFFNFKMVKSYLNAVNYDLNGVICHVQYGRGPFFKWKRAI
jgi:hypothetical protein